MSTFIDNDANQLQFALGLFIVVLHFHDMEAPFGRSTRHETLLHRFEMYSMLILVLLLWCVFLLLRIIALLRI